MDHTEEEMILEYDGDKNDDVIYEEGVDCAGVRRLIRYIRPVKRLEPQWCNNKYYLQLIKIKKVTFEDDMPNIKTKITHNLLTQKIKKSKRMEYS